MIKECSGLVDRFISNKNIELKDIINSKIKKYNIVLVAYVVAILQIVLATQIRNYWCHRGYVDFHYIEGEKEHLKAFQHVSE